MQSSSIPVKVAVPFASSAGTSYINTIPVTTSSSTLASFTNGFPPGVFGATGTPPEGADVNGALNIESQWTQWLCAGGPIPYDGTFQTSIGGYPKGARVLSVSTLGKVWLSTTENNTTNPDTGGAGWVEASATSLGFTPVQQGGGTGQTNAKVEIGQDSATGFLRATIAGTDYGYLASLNGPAGSSTFTEGIISNGTDAGAANIRIVGGNYGAMFQNNGVSLYLLLTNSGNAYGSYNGFRPLSVTLATGAMLIDQTGAGVTFGGPVAANGLLTAEESFQVNGSASVNGYLTVYGNSELTTLGVTGDTNLGGVLNVSGASTLSVLTVTGGVLFDSSANLAGGAIISDGNPFTSSTTEVPNENWVQGAIGNARTTLFPHGLQAFTTSGSVTFVVPSSVYYMEWAVTGGGGGGANCVSSSGSYVSGGGGGAGATAISVVAVTPGQTLTGVVGAGGASLSNGQASSLGGLSAGGGAASSFSGPTTGAGGGGGAASGGQLNIPGGSGSDGQQGALIFAGNGGASFWGGGGRAGSHAGVAGSAPGSGGGGAYDSASSGTNYGGGSGAAGAIVLKW